MAHRLGMRPAFRFNGTSDIDLGKMFPSIFTDFPGIMFYDYSKDYRKMRLSKPSNYHLTFSLSEENMRQAYCLAKLGYPIAVVFKDKLPTSFWGLPVHSGMNDDLRFLDPRNSICGLIAKGRAKHDKSGFVQIT